MKKHITLIVVSTLFSVLCFSNALDDAHAQEGTVARKTADYPFIYGAQYYRAPTPAKENWESDLKSFSELGFTDIKFWIQWRWSHREENEYYYEDLDELITIAEKNNLRVTINTIFDVAPLWLYEKYPDAKQVMNNGDTIEPYTASHRQIGGHPGPCYNHPGALNERRKFLRDAVNHLKHHKSIAFWDVWNEPELSFPQRDGRLEQLACYCPHCRHSFLAWLSQKYGSLQALNDVWGRNYARWEQVELPKNTATIKDFIDWREFHTATLLREAQWRLDLVRELDPARVTYLHVVPNTMQPFNAVTTCMDDFVVARSCDVFAATMNNGPYFTPQVISAAQGKVCYNVESHINGGTTSMHQSVITLNDLLNDFLPQIGMGIKGFMFWQYRPEVLGLESPAWGLTNPDGSPRTVTLAARDFWKAISPHSEDLLRAHPAPPEVAIWKSQKNEIFHYCQFGDFVSLAAATNAYSRFLYQHSYGFQYVNSDMLSSLDGIKVLILPSPYYLAGTEAAAIDRWVRQGGILLSEAHLGAYNDDRGRHSYRIPGFGLDKKWNLREVETTSTYRMRLDEEAEIDLKVAPDVAKMLRDFGTTGGKYVPIAMNDGSVLWGALRFAKLEAPDSSALGSFSHDYPTIVSANIEKGKVYYCGTNIGEGSERDIAVFNKCLTTILTNIGMKPELNSTAKGVWVRALYEDNQAKFIVVRNMNRRKAIAHIDFNGRATGVFSKLTIEPLKEFTLGGNFCDLFVVEQDQ
jgi:beta-galactosidase